MAKRRTKPSVEDLHMAVKESAREEEMLLGGKWLTEKGEGYEFETRISKTDVQTRDGSATDDASEVEPKCHEWLFRICRRARASGIPFGVVLCDCPMLWSEEGEEEEY